MRNNTCVPKMNYQGNNFIRFKFSVILNIQIMSNANKINIHINVESDEY